MNVGIKTTLGSTVRVADVVTANSTFSAYHTNFAHKNTSNRLLLEEYNTFAENLQAKRANFVKKN